MLSNVFGDVISLDFFIFALFFVLTLCDFFMVVLLLFNLNLFLFLFLFLLLFLFLWSGGIWIFL